MQLQFDPSRAEWEAFLDLQLKLVGASMAEFKGELDGVYASVAKIFSRTRNKYFLGGNAPVLRLAHNAQFTIFLYALSRAAFEKGSRVLADRLYALLRIVSSTDIYYEVNLPEIWGCDHPLASVIGRGDFSPDATFFFTQNCNIGNNRGIYPKVRGNLHMMPNSSLLGETEVHGNVVLSNGAFVIDAGKISDCMVFGRSPDLTMKPLSAERFQEITRFSNGS
jgi:serine O-acetyltransferase